MPEFQGKTAVVTGASTGIGREIATMLGAGGARVALLGRSRGGLEETKQRIERAGSSAQVFLVDLRDVRAIEQVATDISSHMPPADFIVHAAAMWRNEQQVFIGRPLAEVHADEIDDVLYVGTHAPMHLTRCLLPGMIRQKSGKILAISGTFIGGAYGWLAYYVSKLALEHFMIGLSQELREHEIQANCIVPSDTATDSLKQFFPADAETALDPIEVAKLARFLLSAEADHITGQRIVIKNKKMHTRLPPNHTF